MQTQAESNDGSVLNEDSTPPLNIMSDPRVYRGSVFSQYNRAGDTDEGAAHIDEEYRKRIARERAKRLKNRPPTLAEIHERTRVVAKRREVHTHTHVYTFC